VRVLARSAPALAGVVIRGALRGEGSA
jgi:hypothetical protein